MSSFVNRRTIRQVLVEWKRSKGMAFDRIASSAFREHRLGSKERRATGDILFTLLRYFPLLFSIRWDPQKAEDLRRLDTVVDELLPAENLPEFLAKKHKAAKPVFAKDPVRHLREIHGCPEFIIAEAKEKEYEGWHDYLHDGFQRAPVGLRVLPDAVDSLKGVGGIEKSEWVPGAYLMNESRDLADLEAFKDGGIEVQDEHSQLVGLLLNVEPGMRVLDLCAGAGGKTLQLAARMKGRGEIFVNDVSARRLEELKKRARRAGISNIRVWDPKTDSNFDRILIDAPCSGLGTLRRTPERLLRLVKEECESLERTQRLILDQALKVASPQTEILYVTCSVRPSENLEHFLVRDDFEPLSLVKRIEAVLGEKANDFLTLARASSAYRISRVQALPAAKNSAFLQWGPDGGSQLSGRLRGDAFFVGLIKCRNREGKTTGALRKNS